MPTAKVSTSGCPEQVLTFRMPIEPADYPDHSPALSGEERQEIAHLLTLSPRYFHAFEQRVERIARVTQPLMDLLRLYRQWRPTSYVPKQYFVSYLLGHVLQANTLYWGWSRPMWEAAIDAIPLRPNAVALRKEPGYTATPGPHSLLAHLAGYLFAQRLLQLCQTLRCRFGLEPLEGGFPLLVDDQFAILWSAAIDARRYLGQSRAELLNKAFGGHGQIKSLTILRHFGCALLPGKELFDGAKFVEYILKHKVLAFE